MLNLNRYSTNQTKWAMNPNLWDLVALFLVLALIVLLSSAAKQMSAPFQLGHASIISLSPSHLPNYALQSVLRMTIALICSLLFTFIFGTWAAKSRQAEKIIIPVIDILQSVPVLAFLSITIVGFIKLFPNSMLGPQCACVFLIFTAQAWNMALSFYQSMRTVPVEFKEAADMFHLSAWQRFWRIEAPFAMPALLWNMMMSMSASWFSLVAAEAISVSGQAIYLPGIGSYIAFAISQANVHAVFYAIMAMFIVIVIYDQVLFRPLISWSEKFKVEQTAREKPVRSLLVNLMQRTRFMRYCVQWLAISSGSLINLRLFRRPLHPRFSTLNPRVAKRLERCWNFAIIVALIAAVFFLGHFIFTTLSADEIERVALLGAMTATRVFVLIIICSLIWVPIGVWVGLRPHVAEIVQPIAQFLAAFPANLLFPVVVLVIVKYHLNVEIWTTPLMMLGAQWYVLFNVIAGASAIPKDLRQVADNLGLRGWLWWRRLILPGIFPFYITGAITAVGGAWNASIVAEVVTWGHTTLRATGLGAYITEYTGNFAHTALGVIVMCLFVFTLNHLIWRPLYVVAIQRFKLD